MMNEDSHTLIDKKFEADDKRLLKRLLKDALIFKETILASGKKSHYYLDARLVTLSAEGIFLTARVLLDFLQEYKAQAVGGLTIGADPIVSAVAAVSCSEDMPVDAFIVRKEAKAHGRKRQIEGPSIKGRNVAIVDDVVTSGGSVLKAAQAAVEAGANVVITTAIVDRMEGARELLEKKGFKFKPIFTIKELL